MTLSFFGYKDNSRLTRRAPFRIPYVDAGLRQEKRLKLVYEDEDALVF